MCRNYSGFCSDKKVGVDFLPVLTDLIKSWETQETPQRRDPVTFLILHPQFLLRNNTNMFSIRSLGKVSCFLLSISSCLVSSQQRYPDLTHQWSPDWEFSSNISARAVAEDTKSLDADLCKPRAGFEPGWSGAETRETLSGGSGQGQGC